jgi:hypothetical protein
MLEHHQQCTGTADFENAGNYFFGWQIIFWAILREILRGPSLF